jgi:hypothetical protein
MKRDKQTRPPSKKEMPQAKLLPPSDVAPRAARGGDKESNEPLRRALKSSGQQTSPGRKPGR